MQETVATGTFVLFLAYMAYLLIRAVSRLLDRLTNFEDFVKKQTI